MAFAAKLGTQTEELITAVTSLDPKLDRERFAALRENSLRILRTSHTNFARTNQFQVAEHLEGLQEKFVVNGCDGLARELRRRLDLLPFALSSSSGPSAKWLPEILHLLLELSDRPVQESSLAALELARAKDDDEDAGPPLRWEDIAREDGWEADDVDPDLWRTVDFHGGSDDEEIDDETGFSSDSGDSSVSSTGSSRLGRILVDAATHPPAPAPSLEDVIMSQAWRSAPAPEDSSGRPRKMVVSEAQVVREIFFMLQGHKTTLFDPKGAPVLTYQLPNISWDTYKALITSVAEAGLPLRPLRDFITGRPEIPLLQTFHDCIRKTLRVFDGRVSDLQARYAAPQTDVVVSVMAVAEELRPHLRPLHALSAIVRTLRAERYSHAFRCLELLFDAACLAQLEGDDPTYRQLGPMFLECFQVYLRPIRLWMEEGQLLPGDRIFFVSESALKVPLNQVWRSQFKLRQTQDGALHAPRFLKPAVSRIFTTGKSIVVLKHLGMYQQAKDQWGQVAGKPAEPSLAFDDICPTGLELAPFAELFSDAFDRWIKSKHHATSATLRRVLFESCGLGATLDALRHVFLMADGAAGDFFASAVFVGIDRMNPRWHDRFTLTELVQESFSPSLPDVHHLSASFDGQAGSAFGRTSVRETLPFVKLRYRTAWPVQLIVPEDSVGEYQQVFSLLLQLRRAVYVLNRHRLLGNMAMEEESADRRSYLSLRARLLWFCNALLTYLTTLVFSPGVADMLEKLRTAEDVDAMIARHSAFVKTLVEESCLGPKLAPIRECILDVLDLAVRLEDARRRNAARESEELREISRLSVAMLSPTKSPSKAAGGGGGYRQKAKLRGRYISPAEEDGEESDDINDGDTRMTTEEDVEDGDYAQTLGHISADFERHLRFITGGLRGVARASGDAPAGKWDMLAEMLETGLGER